MAPGHQPLDPQQDAPTSAEDGAGGVVMDGNASFPGPYLKYRLPLIGGLAPSNHPSGGNVTVVISGGNFGPEARIPKS